MGPQHLLTVPTYLRPASLPAAYAPETRVHCGHMPTSSPKFVTNEPASCQDRCVRIFVLVLAMATSFGAVFFYDNPAALMTEFREVLCGGSLERYLLLYTVYALPNSVLPFFGGYITDTFLGISRAPAFFTAFIALGSGIVAFGVALTSTTEGSLPFNIVLLGRAVYALGGENMAVGVNAIVARWFKGRGLCTAYGVTLTFSRCGSAAAFSLMPAVASSYGFASAVTVTTVVCLASFVAALVLWKVDVWGEEAEMVEESAPADDVSLSDIKGALGRRVRLLYLICPLLYVPVQTFISTAPEFFEKEFELDSQTAAQMAGLPYLISAVASPLFGLVADKLGRPVVFVLCSAIGLTVVHALAATRMIQPVPMVWCMGILFSVACATLWTMLPLVVPERNLGTAYGIMTAMQNLGLGLAPIIVGAVSKPEYLFTACALGAVCCSMALLGMEMDQQGGDLMLPSAKSSELVRATRIAQSFRKSERLLQEKTAP